MIVQCIQNTYNVQNQQQKNVSVYANVIPFHGHFFLFFFNSPMSSDLYCTMVTSGKPSSGSCVAIMGKIAMLGFGWFFFLPPDQKTTTTKAMVNSTKVMMALWQDDVLVLLPLHGVRSLVNHQTIIMVVKTPTHIQKDETPELFLLWLAWNSSPILVVIDLNAFVFFTLDLPTSTWGCER